MKKYFLLIFTTILLNFGNLNAQNISEPDVLKYIINLTSLNFSTSTIEANTQVIFKVDSPNVSKIKLSLLQLTIDSINNNNGQLPFTYNDTTIEIQFPAPIIPGLTETIIITYHGSPKKDPSGWGGFYFSPPYAFNMGVGFDSDPHNLGKVWYPCVDNFTDRAFYDFNITTPTNYKAFCNGTLASQVIQPNGNIIWSWQMANRIPTYLASIAIAPYYTWSRNYSSIPVEIACLPSDTGFVAGTFINLPTVLNDLITAYGPYPFDKVGFCLIPFNSGAMEHATSIHIGKTFINGGLTYETLWAHELSHMWWGDKVTCSTAGDMWLNEGFASFNEAYITQKLYGDIAYQDWLRSNHRKVLQFAHIDDGGYLPLQNIPMNHTYGTTVYNKGADVAHTLRYYMNDSAFFNGCEYYMQQMADSNANSYDLRDNLSNSSGIILNQFFDDWVFTPGFPHFSIDSSFIISGPPGIFNYTIYTRQKSKGNNHTYDMNVPITFSNGLIDTTIIVNINQNTQIIQLQLPNNFPWLTIDKFDHMSDAIIANEKIITSTGATIFEETNLNLNVTSTGIGQNTIRIEHNFVPPDNFKNPVGIRVSDYHYWKVDGILSTGFLSKATFFYNGSTSTTAGYLDNTLITAKEDSLVILYRQACADDWKKVNGYTLYNNGNPNDKTGNIVIDTLKLGEYSLGYYDYTVGIQQATKPKENILKIYPNPSSDSFNIKIDLAERKLYLLCIYDIQGKNVFNRMVQSNENFNWNPELLAKGEYTVSLFDGKNLLSTSKIIYVK